jgi:AhpD family alkylhydroperoxidase
MATVLTKKAELLADIRETFGLVPSWVENVPEKALPGFWQLQKEFYLGETAIPNKYKELIGLAVAGATRCKYCQLFHVEGARLNGATEEEINEAAMMSGVTMLASTYINALGADYDQFARETAEIVAHVKEQAANEPRRPEQRVRV